MSRGIKIAIAVAGSVIVLPIIAIGMLLIGISLFDRGMSAVASREIALPNHATLIIDGSRQARSEHGFSQRAGFRPAGSAEIEWFGDVSDGVEPQVYDVGPLLVVIDRPAAQVFIRTPDKKWKELALVFPNDLGPSFPVSFYAERTTLSADEVARINELGGKQQQKWPTTDIRSFNPESRDLSCDYHLDNKSSWPLRFRLAKDGSHLALVEIGQSSTCCR